MEAVEARGEVEAAGGALSAMWEARGASAHIWGLRLDTRAWTRALFSTEKGPFPQPQAQLSTGKLGVAETGTPHMWGSGETGDLAGALCRAWEKLTPEQRRALRGTLDRLPGDWRGWRTLLDQAAEHVRVALGDKRRVAIVGPANAGKTTLFNRLLRGGEPPGEVSAVPGTTRAPRTSDAGVFLIVDTPGADAGPPEERDAAFEAARQADVLLLLLDAAHGVRQEERALYRRLAALDKPLVVAVNKIDLVPGEEAAVVGRAAAALGLASEEVHPISARYGQGLGGLLQAVVAAEPAITAALGEALPAYRFALAQTVIGRAVATAATIGATPLPIVDFVPLLGVQVAMVLAIARIYAYRITPARARELIAAFGLGFLGRTLFHELSKFGGPPGWLLAAGVAAGTTAAMGYAAAVWFERGERLLREASRRIAAAVGEAVVHQLRDLGRRRPGRPSLRRRLAEAVRDLPLPGAEEPRPDPSARSEDSAEEAT